jgi:hypothetical protein
MHKGDFYELRRELYADPSKLDEIKKTPGLSSTRITKLEHAANLSRKIKREGVVVVRKAITKDQVKESVEDIWNSIINLPLIETEKEKWRQMKRAFEDDYWRDCTAAEATTIKSIYPMTGGFGALTLPPAFHLKTQWQIRQNPMIVDIARRLLGAEKLMVTLDRVSFKARGQVETEFTHWDSNPFYWKDSKDLGIQGIVALCKTSFWAVPRTHTNKFRDEFVCLYPKTDRPDQYFVTKDHDPMDLQSKIVEYKLEAGDFIFWSEGTLHEARINSSPKIRYAYFISYFKYDQPAPAVLKYYSKHEDDPVAAFREDRIKSYNTGCNPQTFPSGTEIKLYAKSHIMYHPEVPDNFCKKMTAGCEEFTYKSGKKKGTTIQVPVNYEPLGLGIYKAPKLSKLGRELLGLTE